MLTQKLLESNSKIAAIQKELSVANETIDQKDKKLYEYKYIINDLKK